MDRDRPSSDSVTVYGTVNGGADISLALADSKARVGYESQNQPPPDEIGVAVEFVDYPFNRDETPEFADHLAAVKEHRPELTVAPDVEDDRGLAGVLDQADQLAEYADDVIVVPKEVHPSEVPDDYRVGIPCSNYGSDAPHDFAEYVDADRCHLLGGPPTLHRELARTYIPVVSCDTASILGGVTRYDVWTWPGRYDTAAYQEAANTDLYDRVTASYDNLHDAVNGAEVAEKLPLPRETADGYEYAEDVTDAELTAMLNGRGPPPCQKPDCINPATSHPELGTVYCGPHAEARTFAAEEHQRWTQARKQLADGLEQAQNQLPKAAVATDGGTPNHTMPDDSTNTDVPLQKNGWSRESDDPLTYEHEEGDVLRIRDTDHGHGVYFHDAGGDALHAQLRYGFYEDRPAAKHRLNKLLGRTVRNIRGEVRQQTKDENDQNAVTFTKSDVTSAAYPAVKGKRAAILARHYQSLSELKDASDAELLALEGIGATTVEGFRRETGDDQADQADETDDRDMDVAVEPSGITRDDQITEITGVGDSSELLSAGFDTVGEWWDGGAPFYGVSGGWQDDALADLLGAEFVDETDGTDLLRIFTGWTNGKVYDDAGEDLGGLPSAMFGQVDWDAARWAWYYERLRSSASGYEPDEMDVSDRLGQFAFATGDDIPRDVLTVGPDDDMGAEGYRDTYSGLSGLHEADGVEMDEPSHGHERAVYTTAAADGQANVAPGTVEFFSTLFATDFTDDAVVRENVELVVTAEENRQPGRNKKWAVIFHHPAGDAHGFVEGEPLVGPADFNLAGGTYDPIQEWAENAAMQHREEKQAHRAEMKVPDGLRSGFNPDLADLGAREDHMNSQRFERRIDEEEDRPVDLGEDLAARQGDPYDPTAEFSGGGGVDWSGVDVPSGWTVQGTSETVMDLQHDDGITAEIWRRDDGRFDAEYVRNGTTYDGTNSFHDSPGAAADDMFPHIKEVRAEGRDRAEQTAEADRVEWPEKVAGYHLTAGKTSENRAVYHTLYYSGVGVLGKETREDEVEIRFYDDTRKYHVSTAKGSADDQQFARKAPAIEAAREVMQENTERFNEIEAEVREENPDSFHDSVGDAYDPSDEFEDDADDGTESFKNPDHDAENADNPYKMWSRSDITTHSLNSAFNADVDVKRAEILADNFDNIRSLSGAIPHQVADLEDVGRGTVRQLWGEEYPDENLTIHHANETPPKDGRITDGEGIPDSELENVAEQIEQRPGDDLQRDAYFEAIGKLADEYDPDRETLELEAGRLATLVWGDDNGIATSNAVEVALDRSERNTETADDGGTDDLADELVDRGINRITANHLADKRPNVDAVRAAVADVAPDVTELKGVGEGSAGQVREAFSETIKYESELSDSNAETDTSESAPTDAVEQLTQVEGIGPKRAAALLDEFGNLGEVSRAASGSWGRVANVDGISEDTAAELFDRMQEAGVYEKWSEATAQTDTSESAPSGAQSEAADQADPDHSESKEASADGGGLPWQARKYLGGAWGRYKTMLSEYREAQEEVADYQEVRDDGEEAAAEINEIRREHGQGPIDFDAAEEDVPGAAGVGGELQPEDVGSSFEWDSDPYDPSAEDI